MSLKEHPTTDREDTASLDAQADKLGSYELGRARALARAGIEVPEEDPKPVKLSRATKRVRNSRRGGRSHSEGTDSELDPYWNTPADDVDQTPNDRARGIAAVRQALEDSKKQPTAEEIEAARAADAAEIRRKATESWGDQV
jgi:hypothetical protein